MAVEKSFDVFLSHHSSDKPIVEVLARRLEDEAGLRPFLDEWHLVPGEPWQEELEQALMYSRTCAVFLGPSGIGSWHNEEMRSALQWRVGQPNFRVIPVLLPGSTLPSPDKLPLFLRRLTWVDFRSGLDDSKTFYRLTSGIRGIAPGRAASIDARQREKPQRENVRHFLADKIKQPIYQAKAMARPWLYGTIGGVLIVGLGLWLLLSQPSPPLPPPLRGNLQVNVSVDMARVSIDGKKVGTVRHQAPLIIRDLKPGIVRILVEADGYEPQERRVNITANEQAQVGFVLHQDMRTTPNTSSR